MRKTKQLASIAAAVGFGSTPQAGASAPASPPSVDATLELALTAVNTDISRMVTLVENTQRVMTVDEAGVMTGYLRALGGIVRDRNKPGKGRMAAKSWDELVELAKSIPELGEALGKG